MKINFSTKFHKPMNKEKNSIQISKVYKLKKEKEIILPLGTCFLDILCTAFKKKKYKILSDPTKTLSSSMAHKHLRFFFGNFYNPLNLLDNLERIISKKWSLKNDDFVYSKEFGHFINLHTKARLKTKDLNLLKKRILEIDKYFLNELKKSTVILLSFETTEVWIDKLSKKTWYSFYGNLFTQKCYKNRAQLKVLDYAALKEVMNKIIKILNKVGNKKKIILMTSPNKLWSTYLNKDVQLSDFYSKSTYTSVFNDLALKNVSYFPALEIVNNINEGKKYRDDYLHLNLATSENVLEPYFNKMYFQK